MKGPDLSEGMKGFSFYSGNEKWGFITPHWSRDRIQLFSFWAHFTTITPKAWHLCWIFLLIMYSNLNAPISIDLFKRNFQIALISKTLILQAYSAEKTFPHNQVLNGRSVPIQVPNFHHMWSWEAAAQRHSRLSVSSKLTITSNNMNCTHFMLQLHTISF